MIIDTQRMIIDTQKGQGIYAKKLLSCKDNGKNILKYLRMKNLKTVSFFVKAKPCIAFLTAYI